MPGQVVQTEEPRSDVDQGKAHDDEAHDRSGAEGNHQTAVQAGAGAGRRPMGGHRGCPHAQVTAQSGEEPAGQKRHGDDAVLHVEDEGHEGEDNRQHDEDNGHHHVLPAEVRHGPVAHVGGDLDHLRIALVRGLDLLVELAGEDQRDHRAHRGDPPDQRDPQRGSQAVLVYQILSERRGSENQHCENGNQKEPARRLDVACSQDYTSCVGTWCAVRVSLEAEPLPPPINSNVGNDNKLSFAETGPLTRLCGADYTLPR